MYRVYPSLGEQIQLQNHYCDFKKKEKKISFGVYDVTESESFLRAERFYRMKKLRLNGVNLSHCYA